MSRDFDGNIGQSIAGASAEHQTVSLYAKTKMPHEMGIPIQRSFPDKLYAILSDPQWKHIISFMEDGRSWQVIDKKLLEKEVLPHYFRSGKYFSFTRKVLIWGFRRNGKATYYHDLFCRDRRDLIVQMTSVSASRENKETLRTLPNFTQVKRTRKKTRNNESRDNNSCKKLSPNNLHLEGPVKRSGSVEPADFAQGSETTTARAGITSPVNNSASDNRDCPASDNHDHFQSVRNNIAPQSLPTKNNDSSSSNQDAASDNYHRGRHGIVINTALSPFVPWKKMTYFGPNPNEISHHANISSVSLFPHRGPPETPPANISICPVDLAPSNNCNPAASLDNHNYHHRSIIIAQQPPPSLSSSSSAPCPNHHRESATITLGQNSTTYRSCPPNKVSRRHDGIPSPPTLVNVTLSSNNLSSDNHDRAAAASDNHKRHRSTDNHDRAAAASDNHKRHRSTNHRVHNKSLACSPTAPVSLSGYNFAIRTLEEWVAQ